MPVPAPESPRKTAGIGIAEQKGDLTDGIARIGQVGAGQLLAHLQQLDQATLSGQVRDQLIKSLPHGEPSAEQLAATLNMSLRSLQRRLEAEHTSYKALLEATRLHLAKLYLSQEKFSLVEISDLLGFRDQSSFSRSFKRWMGMSPRHYREQLHRHVPQGPGPAGG